MVPPVKFAKFVKISFLKNLCGACFFYPILSKIYILWLYQIIYFYNQKFQVDYFSLSDENIRPCETLVAPSLLLPRAPYYRGLDLYSTMHASLGIGKRAG